ncbi:transcriptional activator RfaH [Bradyrhizobium sp. CB1650]|uniref:transcription termination/antitermination protein NusG n=1 Tax=Bradyrhizobium sp. CB1650 TaxID=3039153 RepID=UPI002435F5FD|nr:transcriptional activator RfaH [Bradyrhizobium sp. CB1650]WGD55353.1 transcriptional activator RfaH [Bradyrhizobium sp. CB1650]
MNRAETRRWYVVQTRPHAEVKVAMHLGRQGFDIYIPRYLKRRRHARRVEMVAAPLFPRYVFVAIDVTAQRWRSIQSTFGVARLVCNGDYPAEVPESVIGGLRSSEDERGFVRLENRSVFRLGDKVRILDGAFSACLGLFEGMPDGERIAILLDMLGRKVRIVLDADAIEAA